MNVHQRLEIEQACTRLSSEYALYVDTGLTSRFVELFTSDGSLIFPGLPPMLGRDAMNSYFSNRDARMHSRHVVSNVLIDVVDDQTASGSAYATIYRHVGVEKVAPLHGPAGIALYADEFRLTDSGWKFHRREAKMAFAKRS